MSGEWGPWIGWNGGDCPVDEGDVVEVAWIDGKHTEGKAEKWKWSVSGQLQYMIAYRVKKEPVVEEKKQLMGFKQDVRFDGYYATCTYRDGKLIKIHWEAHDE